MKERNFPKRYVSGRKCRRGAGKPNFSYFLEIEIETFLFSDFFSFFAQRCVLAMLKIWSEPFFEEIIFRSKTPKFFFAFFTPKHCCLQCPRLSMIQFSIKLIFLTGKISATADYNRKVGFSWIFQAVLDNFS